MLFVQVILGGGAVLLSFPIIIHIIWGVATFAVLIATMVLVGRSYGSKSGIFRVSVAAIVDFVIQGILGFFALGSDVIVVVHLTNAFVLAVLATYLISMADQPRVAQVAAARPPGI
jgi:heme A synthase